MPLATDSEIFGDDIVDVEDSASESVADTADDLPAPPKKPMPEPRRATLFGCAAVIALAALAGWLGFRDYQSHQSQAQRQEFLQAAKQVALNLTTVDWQHADTDVQRILAGATGEFRDGFANRSQSFIEMVRQTQATTVGTLTQAGLESETADSAQVLVVVSVQTSKAGAPEPVPRAWRMRISVQKVDDQFKVANVGFVP